MLGGRERGDGQRSTNGDSILFLWVGLGLRNDELAEEECSFGEGGAVESAIEAAAVWVASSRCLQTACGVVCRDDALRHSMTNRGLHGADTVAAVEHDDDENEDDDEDDNVEHGEIVAPLGVKNEEKEKAATATS